MTNLGFWMNPLEVLQLSPGASLDEARVAYHRLAKEWHPDRFSGSEKQAAEAKFREIAAAYAAIKKGVGPNLNADTRSLDSAEPLSRAAGASQAEKTPADLLSEAKNAVVNRQFDAAIAMSQYCFQYPQFAEDARLVYAVAIEATSSDIKAHTRAYEEVIRVNPNNKAATVKLADLYLALNMPARAASMAAKAKSLGVFNNSGQANSRASAQEPAGVLNKIAGFFSAGAKRG